MRVLFDGRQVQMGKQADRKDDQQDHTEAEDRPRANGKIFHDLEPEQQMRIREKKTAFCGVVGGLGGS
jgi:hypothetical protein